MQSETLFPKDLAIDPVLQHMHEETSTKLTLLILHTSSINSKLFYKRSSRLVQIMAY